MGARSTTTVLDYSLFRKANWKGGKRKSTEELAAFCSSPCPVHTAHGFPSWNPSTETKPCLPPLLRPQEGGCSTPPVLPALHGKEEVDLGHPPTGRSPPQLPEPPPYQHSSPTFLLPPGPLGVQLPCQLQGAPCS